MERARTAEQIFADMHRQLRTWNRDVPESAERMDPIMRILLQMYADQLSRIDRRIDLTWDMATGSLIRSLSPETKRWPIPAFTVLRCRPVDPVVEVDPHTRFYYKERREGGQTFFFTSVRTEKLYAAMLRHLYLCSGDTVVDLSPTPDGKPAPAPPVPAEAPAGKAQVYAAFEYQDKANTLKQARLYLKAPAALQKQLRWSYWSAGTKNGDFHHGSTFCPGVDAGEESIFGDIEEYRDWGGLRTGHDLFKPLENSFVTIPEAFTSSWTSGPLDSAVISLLNQRGIRPSAAAANYYWVRIDLPAGGDRRMLFQPFELAFDCFIAINRNELKTFKHTGGSRLVELELPQPISSILDIAEVVDSSGREYSLLQGIADSGAEHFYSLEERDGKLVLWFDFSGTIATPPDSITVTYAVTAGTSANAIEAGKINELYESHPGIESVVNVIPTAGAIPAKTNEQIVAEATTRLRNRDRALTFRQLITWVKTFDPRVKSVQCENGVERATRGVRRCIIVTVAVAGEGFVSDDEIEVLRTRLLSFLKARSPVNTQYQIRITRS
jgi:hypothetical protein